MTDMVKKEESAITSPMGNARGFENMEKEDLIIPRLRLLQSLSQAVADGKGTPGQFQNSVTEDVFDAPIEFVPLIFNTRAVYFKPGQGMVCRSNDGIESMEGKACSACPYDAYWKQWTDNGPPACAVTKEFVIVERSSLAHDVPSPLVLTFVKTSLSLGKRLISMARLSGKDLFATSYMLGTKQDKSDKGAYHNFELVKGTDLTAEEFKKAEMFYAYFGNVTYEAAEADYTDEGVTDI